MSKARNLAKLLVDSNGDVSAGSLDNVPPSNDASALTTGTLAAARLPASGVSASSLTAGTLAAARLPTSGISASAIDTGTLPSTIFPSGCVLQIVQAENFISSEVQFAGGTSYNFPTLSITPKSTGSTLIYVAMPRFYSRSGDRSSYGNGNTYIYIDDVTGGGSTLMHEWINYCDTATATDGLRLSYTVCKSFANTVTTQRQFRTRAYANVPSNGYGRIGGEYLFVQYIIEVE